ncbi:MAG: replicative DNA helicase [Cyanobacteria bacterium J06635_1]
MIENAKHPNVVPVDEQMLPCNIEAEEMILGGILLDPGAISRVAAGLPVDAFYTHAHREVYRAGLELHRQGQVTDLMTIGSRLKDKGMLERVGGQVRLAQLLDRTISAANIDQYADLVLEKYQRRRLADLGRQLQALAQTASREVSDCLIAAEKGYREILALAATKGASQRLSDLLVDSIAEIEERSRSGVEPGWKTGFYDFDGLTWGLHPGDFVIQAGRPSMGKTAGMIGMGRNFAKLNKLPVLIFSLEMSAHQLVYRILGSEVQIESRRLRFGKVANHEWEPLLSGLSRLSELPVWIDDTPTASFAEINAKAQRIKAEQGGLGLVMIDYLQLMGGSENRVQELSAITRQMKLLAKELGCAVVALSQLNRGVESRTNKRPMMSDLRDSGGLEQDADVIVMLYREEYYNPDTSERGIAEWNVVKNRNGPTGTVKLLFEPQYTKFRNLAT